MTSVKGILCNKAGSWEYCDHLEKILDFTLKPGQLKVKLIEAPINPSDYLMKLGTYPGGKEFPYTPGFEGFGEVLEAADEKDKVLVGLKGNCMFVLKNFGSYASHSICLTAHFFPINFEFKQNPFLVNPATSVGLYYYVNRLKSKGFGQTGSTSTVGKMLLLLNQKMGKLKSVNVHRNDKHNEALNQLGSNANINQNSDTFQKEVQQECQKNEVRVFFDCLGGTWTGKIFENLPRNSTLFVYGGLSGENKLDVDASNLIFNSRSLRGFHLEEDFLDVEKLEDHIEELKHLIQNFHLLNFQDKKFKAEQIKEVLEYYQNKGDHRVIFEF